LNNVSIKEARGVKMNKVKILNVKYSIDINMFVELGHNFAA
jgi:hypothetical protein